MRLALALLLLAGCATTPEGIRQEQVNAVYTSAKEPIVIARCLKDIMPALDIYPGENEVSVSNRNQFGSILLNWHITKTPDGSRIEFRRTNRIAPGMARATRCF